MKKMLPWACLLAAVTPLTHAATVRADKLPAPKSMACLQVKQALSYTIPRGLLHIPWEIQLGSGSYVSEHEDANGVYYRAPSSTITERRADQKETSVAGRRITFEGGIYVPNDSTAAPTLYEYYGTQTGVTRLLPASADCATLTYTVDPTTHKVNVWAVGVATGIGAATGMAVGHSVHPQMHGSYGQAAGAGLIGGLIGGLIIGAIENSKSGEIVAGPTITSDAAEQIRAWVTNKVPMTEHGQPGTSGVAAATSPAVPPASDSATDSGTQAAPIAAVPAPAEVQASAPAAEAPTPASVQANEPVAVAPATPAPDNTVAVLASPMASQAQSVANQLRCGIVKANGTGYVAPCGSYGVFIDCDSGQCRPAHTVKLEDMK